MASIPKVETFENCNSNEHGKQQEERNKNKPPGKCIKRFSKTIRTEMKLFASHKFGFQVLKDVIVPSPKIDMSQNRSGQVCVITGTGRGIGFEILKLLLKLDYTVVAGVRDLKTMQSGIKLIRENGILTGHIKIIHLDLKSFHSVRSFASAVLALPEAATISMLINHAGMYQTCYEITEDNMECHFQVNYLSHFLLTKLLLPRIVETAKGKMCNNSVCHIINTSSRFHHTGSLKLDDLVNRRTYVPVKCYCDSKLCLVMHGKTIQNKLEMEGVTNVHVYSTHPGEIHTNIWRDGGFRAALLRPIMKACFRTEADGANVVLLPALSTSTSESCGGMYFELHRVTKPNPQAENAEMRNRLWDLSVKLTENVCNDFT